MTVPKAVGLTGNFVAIDAHSVDRSRPAAIVWLSRAWRPCRAPSRRWWRSSLAVAAGRWRRPSAAAPSPSPMRPRSQASRVEGTGFTGAEIRQSFVLAARTLPIDLVFYDNQRRRCARHRQRRGRDRAQGRSLRAVPPRRRRQCRHRAEAEGRRHSGARGQRSGARCAALQPRQRGGRAHRRRCAGPVRRRARAGQPTVAGRHRYNT